MAMLAGAGRFDDESHTYCLNDGTPLVGVSTILTPIVSFGDAPMEKVRAAAVRGKMVHRACELLDYGTLDRDSLDPILLPYLTGYEKFLKDWSPDWLDIERPEWHPELRYAGMPDRRGLWKGKRILVDLKATFKLNDAVPVQLSGYDLLDENGTSDELWSVRLTKYGKYERHVHKADHKTFLSLLRIFRWREKRGLTYPKF